MKKFMLVALFAAPLLINNTYADEQESYRCPVDLVYKTGAGKSVDMDGGELEITVQGRELILKNSRINGFGTHQLTVVVNTGNEIKGRNKSMIFSYKKVSNEFVLHTGIGPSNFSYSGNGHSGSQMRVAGKCSKQE